MSNGGILSDLNDILTGPGTGQHSDSHHGTATLLRLALHAIDATRALIFATANPLLDIEQFVGHCARAVDAARHFCAGVKLHLEAALLEYHTITQISNR
jgi:hypothetical protein